MNPFTEIMDAMQSPGTRFTLKSWITDALKMDPVDAANDAEWLADVLHRRLKAILEEVA